MENEMIERVAKALVKAAPKGSILTDPDDLSSILVDGQIDFLAFARAAIEAMHDALKDRMATNESIYGPPKDAAHLWGRIENALDTSPEWHCGEGAQKTPQAAEADPG